MVAWVRVAALCGVMLACGGRAQRTPDEGGGGAGSSAGSPSEDAAGHGGTSAGLAGSVGVGGAAGEGVIPTAGTTSVAGASSGSGGTSTWTGFEGPPPGEPSGSHECPQGTTTEYVGALPEVALRFRGRLNGEPVHLETGRMTLGGGCHGDTWTVELFFDGAFAGDQLTLYLDARAGCLAQAWYLPAGEDAEGTKIRSDLHMWSDTEPSPDTFLPTQVVYGALTIQALAVDGSVTHELDGELTIQLEQRFCIG
jgi:hypothetical protein